MLNAGMSVSSSPLIIDGRVLEAPYIVWGPNDSSVRLSLNLGEQFHVDACVSNNRITVLGMLRAKSLTSLRN
jgi:hypothetical protein